MCAEVTGGAVVAASTGVARGSRVGGCESANALKKAQTCAQGKNIHNVRQHTLFVLQRNKCELSTDIMYNVKTSVGFMVRRTNL